MIKIAITDDHPLLLEGIKNVIAAEEDMEVTGTFLKGNTLLAGLKEHIPDVLLLDLHLSTEPQGKELIALVKKAFPSVRILVLTANDNAYNMRLSLNAGAQGYILKNVEQDFLAEAIRAIYNGEEYLSPEVKNILLHTVFKHNNKAPGTEKLTNREMEVLRLIAEEKTSQEIGEMLHLSYRTIETYRVGIMQKLGVKNMVGMVKKAIVLGLIK